MKQPTMLLFLVSSLATMGCVEEGYVPDCPIEEDFTSSEGVFDFDAWRREAEEQGCVTPVGGSDRGAGGAGGAS